MIGRKRIFQQNRIEKVRRVAASFVCFLGVLLTVTGCTDGLKQNADTEESKIDEQSLISEEAVKISEIYRDIYENAEATNTLDDLEVVRSIVNRLGENGYSAVDVENQIDMTEAEQVIQFCEKVEKKEEAQLTVIAVAYDGGFMKYDLDTSAGEVTITSAYYVFHGETLECTGETTYSAHSWSYTEEGYLFFEEYHMPGFDGPSGHTALRVQPLDERCRELNRRYMLPIGYAKNDLFLSDWSEEDFGNIDFYDLFDILYPIAYGKSIPYVADENLSVGAIYRIPRVEFENTIMSCFDISSEILQSKTKYFPEDQTYEYRPRGLYDCESPSIPYPEVVNYVENADGTITLTVHVVYPDQNLSKVYAHEVTVRPFDDGSVQYASNRIIPSEENHEITWHVERLTEEAWEELYEESSLTILQ